MESIEKIAEEILEDAANYKKSLSRECTYADYEKFKEALHINGCYGYEHQLSDILKV